MSIEEDGDIAFGELRVRLSLQIVSGCLEEGVNPTNVCSHFLSVK